MAGTTIRFKGAQVTFTEELICNIVSLRSFAWQQVCRLGECTTVDPVAWAAGAPFAVGKRPSRAHVTNMDGGTVRVTYDGEGRVAQYRLPAFMSKVNNLYTDLDFICPVLRGADIKLDCGSDLEHMLKIDRVDEHSSHDLSNSLEHTSLWRFPPGCSKFIDGGTISDAFSNRTLTAEFLTTVDRLIMRTFPMDFDGLMPLEIAGHSYRIGS
jgi:hypothetical protein